MEDLDGRTDAGLASEVMGNPATEGKLATPNAQSLTLRRTRGRGGDRSELGTPNSELISKNSDLQIPNSQLLQNNSSPLTPNSELIQMWLHGKPVLTVKRYVFWVEDFFETIDNKPLYLVTLEDLHRWQDTLERYAPATRRNAIASIKSLLTFCFELGFLTFNVGKAVKPLAVKDTLNERILTETEVQKMMAMEPNPRNLAILKMLYYGALRVSELVALKWRDVSVRPEGGQITVHGKGEKTRMVLLPGLVWDELLRLRGEASENDPVFRSRQHKNGGHLDPSRVTKIVRNAAKRAELGKKVSPHWLRHCHASHALDRNAPVHLIRDTLGHSSLATTSRYLKGRPKESSSTFLPL